MDPDLDPDPAVFLIVIDLQDANKILIFCKTFFCLLLFEGTFTSFSKIKSHKEVTKQQESRFFLLFFCLMTKGSGSGSGGDQTDPDTQH